MIKNIELKILFVGLLFSNLIASEKEPEKLSFFARVKTSAAGYASESYRAANAVTTTLFGLGDERVLVSRAEGGIFFTGYLFGGYGLCTGNTHLMKVGFCCAAISVFPCLVSSNWRGKKLPDNRLTREDTFFSKSAAAVSLAATLYYLKRNL